MTRPRAALAALGSLLLSAGCLSSTVDEPELQLCETTDDCEGGEVCDEGFCYGDPPRSLQFAAVLQPPGDTSNLDEGLILVPTEIPLLQIDDDGELLNIQFEPHVKISGSVEIPCDALNDPARECGAIEATIEARRTSKIPGVPRFFRTFDTRPDQDGTPRFELYLPASLCGTTQVAECADSYRLIVTPRSGTTASILPDGEEFVPVEQLVPPQTFDIIASADAQMVLDVGDPDKLKTVTGRIETAQGEPGYEVRALGRVTGLSELIPASTVAVTNANGEFSMQLRTDLTDRFDFVFVPGDSVTRPLPTVQLHDQFVLNLDLTSEEHALPPILLPSTPGEVEFSVPITAASTSGETVPVGGATVLFSTKFDTGGSEPGITVTFSTQVTSNAAAEAGELGKATARLFAGTTYDVVVIPPADGEFAAKFDASRQTGASSGTTEAIVLGRRNALRGVLLNSDGNPVASAPITAKASPRFMFELNTDPTSAIDLSKIIRELTFSIVSQSDGSFFMWLDKDLAGQDAQYNISIDPPLAADAPRWTFIDVRASAASTDLRDLVLPRAAYTRGVIRDPGGNPVPGAKLEVYEITTAEFCNNLCTPAPILRGTFVADSGGVVHPVVLPDPSGAALGR